MAPRLALVLWPHLLPLLLCHSGVPTLLDAPTPLLQNHVHYPGSFPQTSLLQKELALGCLKSGHLVCVSAELWASGEEPGTMLRVKAHVHTELRGDLRWRGWRPGPQLGAINPRLEPVTCPRTRGGSGTQHLLVQICPLAHGLF